MANQRRLTLESEELAGDLRQLAEQLGSAESVTDLAGAVPGGGFETVRSLSQLRDFLGEYQRDVLYARELELIQRAFLHASRNEVRELIALDEEMSREPGVQRFATASLYVGKCQLRRLRPLKDHRVVQRYLTAIEGGKAKGWHLIVYGIVLAVYSLPLRQGLVNYGSQTMQGFINAAARRLALAERACDDLHEEVCGTLLPAVEKVVAPAFPKKFQVV
ncbi:MAG TPA: urease accessory UreF family protein [Methylomirabilota bacterium]|nr:urease accessory UreF family protein [Methylomirabilota bacterium]